MVRLLKGKRYSPRRGNLSKLSSFLKGVHSKRKKNAPTWSKIFPLRVTIFHKGLICRRANKKEQILSLLYKLNGVGKSTKSIYYVPLQCCKGMVNRINPDQTAPKVVWYGSTLFVQTSMSEYLALSAICYPAMSVMIRGMIELHFHGHGACCFRRLQWQCFRWAAPCENLSSDICRQRWPRSACAPAQSDQGLHCPLAKLLDTTERINGEQRPGWDFAHAQGDLNLRI